MGGLLGLAVTARPEKWRGITLAWLARVDAPFDHLLMRPADDFRRAPEVKVDLLRPWLQDATVKSCNLHGP